MQTVSLAQALARPRKRYIYGTLAALVVLLLITARLYLGVWTLNYVNRVLHHINGYQGSVESIDIDLYRGAYRINRIILNKIDGHIPTPFVSIDVADISIEWSALLHGRIVSNATLTRPVINFAFGKSAEQTGEGVDWTRPIKRLSPVDINLVTLRDGRLSYQDFSTTPKVNIYIHHMEGEVRDLRNVEDKSQALPTTLDIRGDSIGDGRLAIKGRMNILRKVPDMDITAQLEKVHLPALNSYSDAYASFDFRDGDFSLYSELIVKNNHVSGYIKPVARHVSIVDLRKNPNPLKLVWETVVAGVVELFTNHAHDQVATKIELEGNLGDINTSTWSAIGGILHNAFVRAFTKGLDYNDKSETVKKPE